MHTYVRTYVHTYIQLLLSFFVISFFCLVGLSAVGRILDILNQPGSSIDGPQSQYPQITDLSQISSEAIQASGDVDPLETSPVNLPPAISFVNGKHEVVLIFFFFNSSLSVAVRS